MSQIRVNTIQNANGTTGITFAANGQVTLANTPLQLTGGQIVFPGTQIASGDGNTLDDYEEGTWTPQIDSATPGTGRTVTINSALYTKVGRLVTVTCFVQVATLGSGGSGTWVVKNLPFTSASDGASNHSGVTFGYYANLAANVNTLGGTVQPNSSFIQIRGTTAATSGTTDLAFSTYVGSSTAFILTAVYHAVF